MEANVVAGIPLDKNDSRPVKWAPEVEYVIGGGVALEFELPFQDGELEAYKFVGQVTLGPPLRGRFLQGVQFITEKVRGQDIGELTLLYVPVVRFTERWSALAMLGVKTEVGGQAHSGETLLVNASVFFEPTPTTAAGVELNFSNDDAHSELLVMPQLHHQIGRHWAIQVGIGAEIDEQRSHATAAFRLIWER